MINGAKNSSSAEFLIYLCSFLHKFVPCVRIQFRTKAQRCYLPWSNPYG
jgi:hypothetical protein